MYTKEWAQEDDLTAEGRTRDILGKTMEGIEDYLSFTVESGEQFGGWLPTLDTSMKVTEENRLVSKFFEKDTTKDNTVQKDSAMEENSKIKILSNDLIRRLTNTMECLGPLRGTWWWMATAKSFSTADMTSTRPDPSLSRVSRAMKEGNFDVRKKEESSGGLPRKEGG